MIRTIKLASIVGARPQFIKAAAISRCIREYNIHSKKPKILHILIHTGQHYDENMSKAFFDELKIPKPDYNLGVGSASHGKQTGKMLEKIEKVLLKEKPHICFVYGDTNSTLAGALASAKLNIPLGHVESGLRSFNKKMPEEVNRILADHVATLLFCPTKTAVENLKKEGISQGVYKTGDVMYDCILFYAGKSKFCEEKILDSLGVCSKSFFLATVHRAENTDDKNRLRNIISALNEVAENRLPVVIPLHPRTLRYMKQYNLKFARSVKVIGPVSYLQMVALEKNAKIIMTDSGGIQKEAFCLNTPCITLRDETEWIETVNSGRNILAGANKEKIIQSLDSVRYSDSVSHKALYGDGNAAKKIVDLTVNYITRLFS